MRDASAPGVAVGFDFDHTLGVDNGLERRALFAYVERLGGRFDGDEGVTRAFIDGVLRDFRDGRTSMDAMVADVARRSGADARAARAEDWRECCYALVDALVRPVDGAVDMLTALRGNGIPLAVLTNGWTPLQQKKIARALGEEWLSIPILVSDVLGAIKPSPVAFDALVARLGVARERCWYVGDNARGDVGGALAAGLRAVWLDTEGETYPQDLPPPTARVAALREVPALIENGYAP